MGRFEITNIMDASPKLKMLLACLHKEIPNMFSTDCKSNSFSHLGQSI